ncbi:MAG TPA: glucoamylase family protein [Bryobacteraceae bacterium]|jgi:hypothetical protein|nr:glucoamylase family protein [Bryobacteraceae bacterium]
MTRIAICSGVVLLAAVLTVLSVSLPSEAAPSPSVISIQDRAFLEDVEHRGVLYFWEQTDPATGLVLDRADVAGGRAKGPSRNIASLAATGFGLTAICIGAQRGWIPRDEAAQRIRTTLQFFATRAFHEHGWFYHWMDVSNGERQWDSEVSSVDTSFFLGGALTAAQVFSKDPDIPRLAQEIYDRVDFQWMLDGDPYILSHGWKRGKGFLKYKWGTYSESSLLYMLAIGSSTHPISEQSWYAWQRPLYTYGPYEFISGGPLFTHQYSHAWVDFRTRRDRGFLDFFQNSVNATRANRLYCSNLHQNMALSFGPEIWGITASDGPKGYRIYGEIKAFEPVDGTIAPCAAGGSLMFTPDISIPTLRTMREQFQDRLYGRYGFVDAYNPELKWFDTDVVGIDLGITVLSAENLLSGDVWRWFMSNEAVPHAMDLAGFSLPPSETPAPLSKKPARKAKGSGAKRPIKKSNS